MDRLEAVAHVRQGAGDDDAHRVVEVRDAHLVLDADGADVAQVVGHGVLLLPQVSGGSGWLMGSGSVAEAGGGRGGRRGRRSAGCAGGSRRAGRGARRRRPGASLVRLSRMTHARWPSRVRRRRGRPRRRSAAVVAAGSTLRQRAVRPREGLLDVGLRVADQLAQERRARSDDVRPAAGAPVAVGHRGDRRRRRAGAPSATARRRAARAPPSGTARRGSRAVRVGEVVDGDPVAGLAGAPPEELPGALRVGGEGPLEQPEGEPARLEMRLAEQPIGDEQQRRGPLAAGRVPEPAARRRPAAASGRRGPGRSRARRTAARPGTRGRRGARARGEGRSRTRPGRRRARRGAPELLGRRLAGGDEGDRALGGRARARPSAVRHRGVAGRVAASSGAT